MSIKTFTKSELNEILKKHALWLIGDPNGSKADLYGANLSGANLSGANLREANLSRVKNLNCPITCPEKVLLSVLKK